MLTKLSGTYQFGIVTVSVAGFGGDEETRTPDPLLAKEVLSQLSYIPVTGSRAVRLRRIKRLTTGPEHTRRDGRIGSCQPEFSNALQAEIAMASR